MNCACPSTDAYTCIRRRYNLDPCEPLDDGCSCACHDECDEEEDGQADIVFLPPSAKDMEYHRYAAWWARVQRDAIASIGIDPEEVKA